MVHTILGHVDLHIDFWPHFWGFQLWSISPILQLTFLKYVLCKTNSFWGIGHVTVAFENFLVAYACKFVLNFHFNSI